MTFTITLISLEESFQSKGIPDFSNIKKQEDIVLVHRNQRVRSWGQLSPRAA